MAGSKPKRASFYADLDHLRTHFDALDSENCGYIGYEQLKTLAKEIQGFDDSMVSELMEKLDRDKDGKVSFEDFQALFEIERGSTNEPTASPFSSPSAVSHRTTSTTDRSLAYNTAFESLPVESITSPRSPTGASAQSTDHTDIGERQLELVTATSPVPTGSQTESPTVVLRHKRVGRRSTSTPVSAGGRRRHGTGVVVRGGGILSPIHGSREGGGNTPASDMPDLAPQMHHVSGGDSPQLNRRSRVLSWISESEDVLLEDAGSEPPGAFSPLTSPQKSGDEASHVKAILESVCQSHEVGKEAITRLCSHVKADPQEEQELLSLLDYLDKNRQGWVSLDDFVKGLQSIKNAALVSPLPPPKPPRRGRHGDEPIPVLSESFSTPVSSNPVGGPMASTPLPPAARAEETTFLSVLDPDSSGYVNVDSVMNQWLKMGVDTPDDHSLHGVLSEVVPMDASGRMSVSELTASLEGAVLAEERTPSVLRHAALKSFKTEISSLRTQVHQVSLERDKLRTSLSRTLEENKKLVREGDEHVDLVTDQSEKKIKEEKVRHTEQLKEVERSRLEEAKLLEEQAVRQIKSLEDEVKTLKSADEKLRTDLKYAQEDITDVTERLSQAHRELTQKERTICLLQKDLSVRSEQGYSDDLENQLSRISELENEISERVTQQNEVLERTRELQDQVDLITAENEEWRQKYMSQKRKMQRGRSSGSIKHSDSHKQRYRRRHSSDESNASRQRPKSAGSRRTTSTSGVRSMARPFSAGVHRPQSLYDDHDIEEETSEGEEDDVFEPISPLSLDDFDPLEVQEVAVVYHEEEEGVGKGVVEEEEEEESSSEDLESSNDDFCTRSTASLLEEFQNEVQRTKLEKAVDQLGRVIPGSEIETSADSEQLTANDETVRMLEEKLQEQKARSDEYSQKLEGECSRLVLELQDLQQSLENEQAAHQQNLEEVRQKLQITEAEGQTRESAGRAALTEAREELEKAQHQLDDYKRRAKDLEEELKKAAGVLRLKEEELVAERKRAEELQAAVPSEPTVIVTQEVSNEEVSSLQLMMEQVQEDYVQCCNKNERLERDLQVSQSMLAAVQKSSEEEVSKLQTQLINAHKEISDQSSLYEEEIAQLKDESRKESQKQKQRSDTKLAEVKAEFERQTTSSRHRHDLQLQVVKQDLKSSEMREKTLREKLSLVEVQCENAFNELTELQAKTASWETQITEFEEKEDQFRGEISHLELDVHKYQEELVQLRASLKSYKDQGTALTGELQHKAKQTLSPIQEGAHVEEVDWLESGPRTPSPRPQSRSSFYSEQSAHEELILQMKSQLEELQKVLVLQGKGSRDDGSEFEASLVQELITNNASLQIELQKLQENVEAERLESMEALSSKEDKLELLISERKTTESLLAAATNKLIGEMMTLAERSRRFLSSYGPKLQSAAAAVSSVKETLSDRDHRQTGAFDSLLEDLDQSRELAESYRTEVNQLKSVLEGAQDDPNQPQNEVSDHELQRARQEELEKLQLQLEEAHREKNALANSLQNQTERASLTPRQEEAEESAPPTPIPRPSSRSSYHSDESVHEGLLTQMKFQLEELQKVLTLQRKDGGEDSMKTELSLVQELIANSASLQEQNQKQQRNFEAERERNKSVLSSREEEMKLLTLEASRQKRAMETLLTATSDKLLKSMSALVEQSKAFLGSYGPKLQSAVSTLSLIQRTLRDRDSRHTSAIDGLLEDLDHSRSVIESYRTEVDQLQADMDATQENLNQSQSELSGLQLTKKEEVERLTLELQEMRREKEVSVKDQARDVQNDQDRPHVLEASTEAAPATLGPDDTSRISAENLSKDREIQALRQDLEMARTLEKQAQDAHAFTVGELVTVKSQLREAEIARTALESRLWELESREQSPKVQPKRSAASAQGDNEDLNDEILKRDKAIQKKEEEIHTIRLHLDTATSEAKKALEAHEQAIKEKDLELKAREGEIFSREKRVRELEHKLESVVSEPVEAVVQYMELQPLESVNEAMLMEMQREVEVGSGRLYELESEHSEEMQQLREDLNRSLSDSLYQCEQTASLRDNLQEAEDKLKAAQEENEAMRNEYERTIQDMREKHSAELSAAHSTTEDNTREVKGIHYYLVSLSEEQGSVEDGEHLEHSALLQKIRREIDKLKAQLSVERLHVLEMEETVSRRMEEHDEMEEELHSEHEEEVRALYQQQQQLCRKIEKLRDQYHEVLSEQEKRNSAILREVLANKAQLETDLQEKAEEQYRAYQQIADMLEERKVLMDIVQQLAFQAGKQIDVL